ncbi:hypothetical protein PSACC_03079, partial [Paramicrosporidium saccamoebae]
MLTTNHDAGHRCEPPYPLCDDPAYTLTRPPAPRPPPRTVSDFSGFESFLATLGLVPPQSPHVAKLNNLLAVVEGHPERRALRQLLADAQPRQSKWFDPGRSGQAELYDALERILLQLKNTVPHSLPFLQRESPFRNHVNILKDRWTTLLQAVPDIVVGGGLKDEMDTLLNDHLSRLSEDDSSAGSIASTSHHSLPQPTPLKNQTEVGLHELELPIPRRSAVGMGGYHRSRSNPETMHFHQSFPDCIPPILSRRVEKTIVNVPLDKDIYEQCDLLRQVRAATNGTALTASPPPNIRSYSSGNVYTPRLGDAVLLPALGWLLLQAGFQSFNPAAASLLSDLTSHFILEMLQSLKLFIECTTSDAITLNLALASHLLADHTRRRAKTLLRYVQDQPVHIRRLTKALSLVKQRKEPSEPSESMIVDEEVDLELLGDPAGWVPAKRPLAESEGEEASLQELLNDNFVPSERYDRNNMQPDHQSPSSTHTNGAVNSSTTGNVNGATTGTANTNTSGSPFKSTPFGAVPEKRASIDESWVNVDWNELARKTQAEGLSQAGKSETTEKVEKTEPISFGWGAKPHFETPKDIPSPQKPVDLFKPTEYKPESPYKASEHKAPEYKASEHKAPEHKTESPYKAFEHKAPEHKIESPYKAPEHKVESLFKATESPVKAFEHKSESPYKAPEHKVAEHKIES